MEEGCKQVAADDGSRQRQEIKTLVFDYGGVIVNLDMKQVRQAMVRLGVSPLAQLWHARRIRRLMREYIDGLVPTEQIISEVLSLCKQGTTTQQLEDELALLCGDLPITRLEALMQLRKHYKVYMLSNINDPLWQKSRQQIKAMGYEPEDCFDGFFLSYEMGYAKPSTAIYRQMIEQTGLDPSTTLYFDDREDNYKAGRDLGFQAVLVETNHLEDCEEWQQIRPDSEQ